MLQPCMLHHLFLWYQETRCHDLGFPCASSDWSEFPRRIHKQMWNSDAYVIRAAHWRLFGIVGIEFVLVWHLSILLSVEEMQAEMFDVFWDYLCSPFDSHRDFPVSLIDVRTQMHKTFLFFFTSLNCLFATLIFCFGLSQRNCCIVVFS